MRKNVIKNLFGSNTRIKLLELFFSNPDKFYYVREITRLVNEQINSVRRELSNLEETKVVKKIDKDNKVYYGVNRKFKEYLPFAMIFDEGFDWGTISKNTVSELANEVNLPVKENNRLKLDWQKLVAKAGDDLKILILGGSLSPDSTSTIDMLIVGDNGRGQLSNWAKKIEKIFGSDLSYSIMDYEEFYYRHSVKDKFIMSILDSRKTVIKDTSAITKG